MIRIRDLWMTYRSAHGEHTAVKGISLDVKEGEFYTLLGPSGCGKTTTLRCVAGLERPDRGEIEIAGDVVFSSERKIWVEPYHRNIGMVFQSYAIWPHMTVFDNVAFPLRHKRPRPARRDIRDQVMRALALVHLDGLEDRPAPFLSGGQQQRLALARALVAEPRVLLLDEPLSNLDAKLREEMRSELRDVVERLRVTTLFVTHEQIEALTMSDTIAVMNDGAIVQEGSPSAIYNRPSGEFVADFIGKTNILPGRIAAIEVVDAQPVAMVECSLGQLRCLVGDDMRVGDALVLTVRPENIVLANDTSSFGDSNVVPGNVEAIMYLGNIIECTVAVGNERLRLQLHPANVPARGSRVHLHLPSEHCLAMRL
jgi:iron(III) transport system ATP-binding protein